MASTCRGWHRAFQAARPRFVDWRVVRAQGTAIPQSLDAFEDALQRDGGPRYPPTVMIVTLAFDDHRETRHAAAVWSELLDRLERARLLPFDCVVVGLLQLAASPDASQTLTITLSMGHLAVDVATFDRKELRWSASGLSDRLPCPWEHDEPDTTRDVDAASDSFLLLSSNRKAAQNLLELTMHWFPDAERRVLGGVLGPADSSAPLMLYRSSSVPSSQSRKSYATRQRRRLEYRNAPRPFFPCALLLRLRGSRDVTTLPFAWSSDRPVLHVVLRCNRLVPMHAFDTMRSDLLSYDTVSVLHGEDDSAASQTSLLALLQSIPTRETSWTLLVSPTRAVLDALLSGNATEETVSLIRRVTVFLSPSGVTSQHQHWGVGEFALVCAASTAAPLSVPSGEEDEARTLGGIVFSSRVSVSETPLEAANVHVCQLQDEVIAPFVLPIDGAMVPRGPSLLQAGIAGGVMLAASTIHS
ncbi:hypothetical protein PINS_up002195 [Pythium insidiosum]|nr:hypothetical protein PINS_up002195 [Pythium insidiosum]